MKSEIKEFKIKKIPYTKRKFIKLLRQYKTYSGIAVFLGCTRQRVCIVAKKLGIEVEKTLQIK